MRFLVAIPVFNEERHLDEVLDALRPYASDVLVINDGSTDGTAAILRRRGVPTLDHLENRGYGQSLIDAFDYADRHGYDWVITMDCDKQHTPQQIPEFVEAIQRANVDVVSGSRYLTSWADDDEPPVERRRINLIVNELLDQTLDLKLTDSFCGFKAHRVSAMRALRLDEPGYAFPMQFWVEVVRAGLRVAEIPVRRIYRDKTRTFGGTLDDPSQRLQHYLEVFVAALRREPTLASATTLVHCERQSRS